MKKLNKKTLSSPTAVDRNLRCCFFECAEDGNTGSIGAHYVVEHARQAGFTVDVLGACDDRSDYDVELVSVHHCTDWVRLARTPKHAKVRVIGGHVTIGNPRPGIPMTDVVCLGEGESWIVEALSRLDQDCRAGALERMRGTIISSDWRCGNELPSSNFEDPLPDNDPYLNRAGTRSSRWYIEIARGCPFRCAYCELGNNIPYRYYGLNHIKQKLDMIDPRQTRKLNWFAPDEASHPQYVQLMDELRVRKYQQAFGSYRVDQVLRRDIVPYSASQLIRIGVDGLTEKTRFRVGKKITNDMLMKYFVKLSQQGHVQFKMFMIFGYPWEQLEDFDEWATLMSHIMHIKVRRSCWLRVKWTPLIPQVGTPLADVSAKYDIMMVNRIQEWHQQHRQISKHPGWHIECDGLMSLASHGAQVRMTGGDESLFLGKSKYINPAWSI